MLFSNILSKSPVSHLQDIPNVTSSFALSNIRVFATFSVLIGHSADSLVKSYTVYNKAEWWIGNFYISFFRSGLPLFLFISGFLLLPKATGYNFILKRCKRIIIPYLIWNLVYFIYNHRKINITIEDIVTHSFKINYYHLWFIYIILIVYILMPFIKRFADNCKYILIYSTIVYISGLVGYFLLRKIYPNNIYISYSFHVIVYSYYVLIGYKTYLLINQQNAIEGLFLFFLCFAISLIGNYLFLDSNNLLHGLMHNSFNLHILLKAICSVLIIKYVTEKLTSGVNIFLSNISNFCFGIYLIHPLILNFTFIYKLGRNYHYLDHFFLVPINAILCFSVSLMLIYCLSKLPFGRIFY